MSAPDQFLHLGYNIEDNQPAEQIVATPKYLSRLIQASEICGNITSNWK